MNVVYCNWKFYRLNAFSILIYIKRWGDPNNGLSLKDCCLRKPKYDFLYQMSVEYTNGNEQITLEVPNMKLLCSINTPNEIIQILCNGIPNPPDDVKVDYSLFQY